jgi:hypothetical protein
MLKDDQTGATRRSDAIHGDMDLSLTSHVPPGFMHITYPIEPLERDTCHPRVRARVTPDPSTCQPLVRAHLANVVGEGTGTPESGTSGLRRIWGVVS